MQFLIFFVLNAAFYFSVQASCAPCAAGKDSVSGTGACTRCPAGKFDTDDIVDTFCGDCTASSAVENYVKQSFTGQALPKWPQCHPRQACESNNLYPPTGGELLALEGDLVAPMEPHPVDVGVWSAPIPERVIEGGGHEGECMPGHNNQATCVWTIFCPRGTPSIEFEKFNTGALCPFSILSHRWVVLTQQFMLGTFLATEAAFDVLTLYDGDSEQADQLAVLDGYKPSQTSTFNYPEGLYHATGRSMRLKFQSDAFGAGMGFLGTYTCNGDAGYENATQADSGVGGEACELGGQGAIMTRSAGTIDYWGDQQGCGSATFEFTCSERIAQLSFAAEIKSSITSTGSFYAGWDGLLLNCEEYCDFSGWNLEASVPNVWTWVTFGGTSKDFLRDYTISVEPGEVHTLTVYEKKETAQLRKVRLNNEACSFTKSIEGRTLSGFGIQSSVPQCVACPRGTFSDPSGAKCQGCPPGTLSEYEAKSEAECSTSPIYAGCYKDTESVSAARDLTGKRERIVLDINYDDQYVGCFADSMESRDLSIATGGLTATDRKAALNQCAEQCTGYQYMGLQWKGECYCGDVYGSHGPADGECPSNCGLPGGTECGNRNAVYRVFDVTVDPVRSCQEICRGYRYMGLQFEDLCFCGNKYGSYGEADSVGVCTNNADYADRYGRGCVQWEGVGCNWTESFSTTGFGSVDKIPNIYSPSMLPEIRANCPKSCGYCDAALSSPCGPRGSDCGVHAGSFKCRMMNAVFELPTLPYCADVVCQAGLAATVGNENISVAALQPDEMQTACCERRHASCQPGKWNDEGRCRACLVGKVSTTKDASECSSCGPGKSAAAQSTQCVDTCEAGTFSSPGARPDEHCTPCAPGRHDHDLNQHSGCILCQPGTYSAVAGAVACIQCPPGKISASGAGACSPTLGILGFAEIRCPVEWAACDKTENCFEQYVQQMAFWGDREGFGRPGAVTELIACVEIGLWDDRLPMNNESSASRMVHVRGCTDSAASNFDAMAIEDDNSCEYDCPTLLALNELPPEAACFLTDRQVVNTSAPNMVPSLSGGYWELEIAQNLNENCGKLAQIVGQIFFILTCFWCLQRARMKIFMWSGWVVYMLLSMLLLEHNQLMQTCTSIWRSSTPSPLTAAVVSQTETHLRGTSL
jgi:hypothetical protein